MSDELVLTIDPPYIGSAVSPEVDITETDTTYTVDITDFRGVHSYTVEKTDQAIADAEQAATNANTAASQATATANAAAQYARDTADQAAADVQETADEAAGRADTAAASANQAAQSATTAAGTANTAATNADAKAALADSKAGLADSAATSANQAAQAAETAKTAANTAASQATTAAGNANTAAQIATTAATNADTKAQLADTAATNADTATQAANTATTAATNAAQAANNAADYAIEAADDMPKLIATVDSVQTVSDAWPTTLHGAALYGKSVQDGTPTPDNPVPVQVVGGRNLFNPVMTNDGTQIVYSRANVSVNNGLFVFEATNADMIFGYATYSAGVEYQSTYGILIPVISNTPYTLKCTNSDFNKPFITWYDASKKVISANGGNTNILTATSPATAAYAVLRIGKSDSSAGTTYTTYVQFEAGTQATPYTPYGCIGLRIGETVTPIDLQGYTLAGGDVLRVNAAGRVWIEQPVNNATIDGVNVKAIAIDAPSGGVGYRVAVRLPSDAATITADIRGNFVSSHFVPNSDVMGNQRWQPAQGWMYQWSGAPALLCVLDGITTVTQANDWFAANPTTVYYPLATPQTIELGTIAPPTIAPGDTLAIYASLDPEWAIEYEQDPNIVVTALQSSIAPVEGGTASTNYAVNSYLIHANQLYRVTSAIATGEAITPGTNCVACTVMGEVIRLTA